MSFATAVSGAYAAQRSIAINSNNVANIGTTAFKSDSVSFEDIFGTSRYDVTRSTVGQGAQVSSNKKNLQSGPLSVTGSSTDMAISGSAFFVTAPKHEGSIESKGASHHYFTKNGNFKLDTDGYLLTNENYHVLNTELMPVKFPSTTITSIETSHEIKDTLVELSQNVDNLNLKEINFSVKNSDTELGFKENEKDTIEPGDISIEDGNVFYVPDLNVLKPATKVQIGEVGYNANNDLSIHFNNTLIEGPYKVERLVDVQKLVEIEYQETEMQDYFVTEFVAVKKDVVVGKERVYLDTYSQQNANFSSPDEWTVVNERFYSGVTAPNGATSPVDDTYGYQDNSIVQNDAGNTGSIYFDTEIISGGEGIKLITGNGTAGRYQTTRGPYIHTSAPLALQEGTQVSFDWTTVGSEDAFDLFVYLRDIDTGVSTIAVNATGQDRSDRKSGTYSFDVPSEGTYDLVFVGGTWDASGFKAAGAVNSISNLTYQTRDYEERDIIDTVTVMEPRQVKKTREVTVTKTREELQTVQELREVTIYEDTLVNLDSDILTELAKKFQATGKQSFEGDDVTSASISSTVANISVRDNNKTLTAIASEMDLKDVKYLGSEEKFNLFDSFEVDNGGNILVTLADSTGYSVENLGTIATANPVNQQDLVRVRSGYFVSPDPVRVSDISSIKELSGGSIIQGSLEKSNVDLMGELSSLIENQLKFNANGRAIQAYLEANKTLREVQIS